MRGGAVGPDGNGLKGLQAEFRDLKLELICHRRGKRARCRIINSGFVANVAQNAALFVTVIHVPMNKGSDAGDREYRHHQEEPNSLPTSVDHGGIIPRGIPQRNIAILAPEVSDEACNRC